jgi:hypothetical protein
MSDLNMCGLCSYLVYIKYLHFRNIDFATYIRIRVPTPPPTSRIRRASDEKSSLAGFISICVSNQKMENNLAAPWNSERC